MSEQGKKRRVSRLEMSPPPIKEGMMELSGLKTTKNTDLVPKLDNIKSLNVSVLIQILFYYATL